MAKLPDNIVDPVAKSIYEEASKHKEKRKYLGCSQAGHPCDRYLWYVFRSFPKKQTDGRIMLIFEVGNNLEDLIIKWLRKSGYIIESQQLEFQAIEGFLRGHCDGVIYGNHLGQKKHILEIKTASKSRFEQFQQRGIAIDPKYEAQAQLYMGLGGYERALFVVFCKNDSSIYSERLYFSKTKFNELLEKAYRIIYSDKLPDKTASYFDCKFCDYSLICNEEEPFMSNDDKFCGTCRYSGWHKGCKSWCKHPNHPYPILRWGEGCQDWVYLFAKVLPNDMPWPDKVSDEQLKEYPEKVY
ncbi:MAG: hypothetical protein HQK78_03175 [Desulfobacterales bacterium]|nr:hypothetical protein [Desulfobacterales bacterium]